MHTKFFFTKWVVLVKRRYNCFHWNLHSYCLTIVCDCVYVLIKTPLISTAETSTTSAQTHIHTHQSAINNWLHRKNKHRKTSQLFFWFCELSIFCILFFSFHCFVSLGVVVQNNHVNYRSPPQHDIFDSNETTTWTIDSTATKYRPTTQLAFQVP